jgi:invasion protein IalB
MCAESRRPGGNRKGNRRASGKRIYGTIGIQQSICLNGRGRNEARQLGVDRSRCLIAHLGFERQGEVAVELSFSGWIKQCPTDSTFSGQGFCVVGQVVRASTSKKFIASAMLIEPQESKQAILRIIVPLNMQIAPGLKVSVDQNPVISVPYVSCVAFGCVADYVITADVLNQLKRGSGLVVQATNSANLPISVVFPLNAFEMAYNGRSVDATASNDDAVISNAITYEHAVKSVATVTDFAPWSKVCFRGQPGKPADPNAKELCYTGKSLYSATGQVAAQVVLIEPKVGGKGVFRITVPLGTDLAHGTRLLSDQSSATSAPFLACFAGGCVAEYDVDAKLAKELRVESNVTLEAASITGQPINQPISLENFAKVRGGPPTDRKVFAEQLQAEANAIRAEAAARRAAEAGSSSAPKPQTTSQDGGASSPTATLVTTAVPTTPSVLSINSVGSRVALVIGNSNYAFFPKLPNPQNDAQDLAAELKNVGFDVLLGTDLKRAGMEDIFIRFAKKVRDSDTALVFYAGHGLQHQGLNYLAPVDAKIDDETDLRKLVNLQDVLADLQNAGHVRILIVDACRDNTVMQQLAARLPATRSAAFTRGLAAISGADGTLIAFATQPNKVAEDGSGRNSPFTAALLKNLPTKGLELRTLMTRVRAEVVVATHGQQRPEVWDSLVGEFTFQVAQ